MFRTEFDKKNFCMIKERINKILIEIKKKFI